MVVDTMVRTNNHFIDTVERKTRFELATLSLARRCSTTEPLPLVPRFKAKTSVGCCQGLSINQKRRTKLLRKKG